MTDNERKNNYDASEEVVPDFTHTHPIFSLSLSFTGSQFIIDTNQLNILSSVTNGDENTQKILTQLQEHLRSTYKEITPLFEQLLLSVFGEDAISKSEIKSVSESTMFYIGGDADD